MLVAIEVLRKAVLGEVFVKRGTNEPTGLTVGIVIYRQINDLERPAFSAPSKPMLDDYCYSVERNLIFPSNLSTLFPWETLTDCLFQTRESPANTGRSLSVIKISKSILP